nr:hypothetical protein Iba_chr07aCG7410 [Ipomoea batatas]
MEKRREKEAQELSSDNMPWRERTTCAKCASGEEEEKHFHPDRGAWRAEAEEIQEEEATHDVVDLLGRLKPHWGATVKRERRNVASPRIPKLLRFDLNEIPADAAANVDDQFN